MVLSIIWTQTGRQIARAGYQFGQQALHHTATVSRRMAEGGYRIVQKAVEEGKTIGQGLKQEWDETMDAMRRTMGGFEPALAHTDSGGVRRLTEEALPLDNRVYSQADDVSGKAGVAKDGKIGLDGKAETSQNGQRDNNSAGTGDVGQQARTLADATDGVPFTLDNLKFKNETEYSTWLNNKTTVEKGIDADGNIEIAGRKVHFGTRSVDGQWDSTSDLFKRRSIAEIESDLSFVLKDADDLQKWFGIESARSPYAGAPAKAKLSVSSIGRINGHQIVVDGQTGGLGLGQGLGNERRYISINQDAIAPDRLDHNLTLIYDAAIIKGKKKYGNRKSGKYPSDTISNSHTEIALINNAHNAGLITPGSSMTMSVSGLKICTNCRWQIALIAQRAGLGSLTIVENTTGRIFYWYRGLDSIRHMH